VFDTFGGDLLESVGEGTVERGGDLDVETASDEGEPERFGGVFGDVNADAAEDTFAGFEDDVGGMPVLFEEAALPGEPVGVRAIEFGVVLKVAVAGGAAVAVEATGGFASSFLGGEPGV
jgi:hypothetical protein